MFMMNMNLRSLLHWNKAFLQKLYFACDQIKT